MKRFKVYAAAVTYFAIEVEAENEEQAKQLAEEADGSDFVWDSDDSMTITDAVEVKQ